MKLNNPNSFIFGMPGSGNYQSYSTVADYTTQKTSDTGVCGWGQKLPDYFGGVQFTNLAVPGRSSRSFLTDNNYETLKNSLGKGDYLFIQFGHNDEKTDESQYPGIGAYTVLDWNTLDANGKDSQGRYSYEYLLTKYYIDLAKSKGAVPVLVTPITRMNRNAAAGNRSGESAIVNETVVCK